LAPPAAVAAAAEPAAADDGDDDAIAGDEVNVETVLEDTDDEDALDTSED